MCVLGVALVGRCHAAMRPRGESHRWSWPDREPARLGALSEEQSGAVTEALEFLAFLAPNRRMRTSPCMFLRSTGFRARSIGKPERLAPAGAGRRGASHERFAVCAPARLERAHSSLSRPGAPWLSAKRFAARGPTFARRSARDQRCLSRSTRNLTAQDTSAPNRHSACCYRSRPASSAPRLSDEATASPGAGRQAASPQPRRSRAGGSETSASSDQPKVSRGKTRPFASVVERLKMRCDCPV